jgi:nucleolar protein 56
MDKNINTFVMRLKEWFSWHFPELGKIVTDNFMFVKVVQYIGKRDFITSAVDDEGRADKIKDKLEEIILDEEKAQQIIDAAKISMGQPLGEADELQLSRFSERCFELIEYRDSL